MARKSEEILDSAELGALNAALEAEIALYHDAVEGMHQGLCMFDPDGRIVLVNRRYAELMGVPPGSVRAGMTGSDVIQLCIDAGHYPDQSFEQVRGEVHTQIARGSKDLGVVNRGSRSYAMRQSTTANGDIVTTCENITAQVEAERALRDSEARLSAILDAMPDCVKIFDASGTLIHINPQGLALLQAPDIESLSASGHLVVPPEYLDRCLDVHWRVMAGESVVWTYEVIGLQGRRRHVEAHAVPFVMPDGARVHMCISRDVEEREQEHRAMRRNEERLRLVQEATGLADFEARPGGISQISDAFNDQVGLPKGTRTLTFEAWLELVHPDDREFFAQHIMSNIENDDTVQCEFRIVRPDNGNVRWILSRTQLQRDESGKAIASIGAHLDITERKLARDALHESEERFRLAAEAAGLGVWDYDLVLHRRQWSGRMREIFGFSSETEPTLAAVEECIHPADLGRFNRTLHEARENDLARFEISVRINRANDGAARWITMSGWRTFRSDNELRRIITTVRDVTEEKTAEARVRWSASHDTLTRLANRTLFNEKLDRAIRCATAEGGAVGLLMLDLDHFKQINDTLGHDAGDMFLQTFAERLREVVRAQDTVARFGGDEFAVVLPNIRSEQCVIELCRSIEERLREPFVHEGRMLDCRVSMGASVFPRQGRTSEELLKNADMALYASKAGGRGMVSLFDPRMRDHAQLHSSMVQLARNALDDDRIIPYYQPKLDLAGRTIVGFEALLRWRTASGRIGTPALIEAAFEEPDVAAQISDRMITRVIEDMRGWLDRGVPFQHVAVNASAAEFRRDNFAERVIEQLSRADIPTRCFQLEVTETVFLGRGAEYVHRALALLSMRGIKIALDDFGTGYASLRHLKEFPVDVIKIDQSFVREMENDQGDEAIIRAVINLGRSLGIKVVAEGIETAEQKRRLIDMKCDFGQGYLFSRAIPASRVPRVVQRWLPRSDVPSRSAHDLRLIAGGG